LYIVQHFERCFVSADYDTIVRVYCSRAAKHQNHSVCEASMNIRTGVDLPMGC